MICRNARPIKRDRVLENKQHMKKVRQLHEARLSGCY